MNRLLTTISLSALACVLLAGCGSTAQTNPAEEINKLPKVGAKSDFAAGDYPYLASITIDGAPMTVTNVFVWGHAADGYMVVLYFYGPNFGNADLPNEITVDAVKTSRDCGELLPGIYQMATLLPARGGSSYGGFYRTPRRTDCGLSILFEEGRVAGTFSGELDPIDDKGSKPNVELSFAGFLPDACKDLKCVNP